MGSVKTNFARRDTHVGRGEDVFVSTTPMLLAAVTSIVRRSVCLVGRLVLVERFLEFPNVLSLELGACITAGQCTTTAATTAASRK